MLPGLLTPSIAAEKVRAITLNPWETFGIFSVFSLFCSGISQWYTFFKKKNSFVYTWWAFQSRDTVRLLQLGQVSLGNKDLLCIRSELREDGETHFHILWRICILLLCLSFTFQRTLCFQGLCFLDTLRRWILWLLQDIHWHLGCNCLCFWKVSCCFSSFKCLLKSLYPWNFSFHILFVLNMCIYLCGVCVYVCVCIYTHLHTHFIYHHLNGLLIYPHTSAAPVFNLDFLKKFFKLFLVKNSKQKSEETINNNINLGSFIAGGSFIIWGTRDLILLLVTAGIF